MERLFLRARRRAQTTQRMDEHRQRCPAGPRPARPTRRVFSPVLQRRATSGFQRARSLRGRWKRAAAGFRKPAAPPWAHRRTSRTRARPVRRRVRRAKLAMTASGRLCIRISTSSCRPRERERVTRLTCLALTNRSRLSKRLVRTAASLFRRSLCARARTVVVPISPAAFEPSAAKAETIPTAEAAARRSPTQTGSHRQKREPERTSLSARTEIPPAIGTRMPPCDICRALCGARLRQNCRSLGAKASAAPPETGQRDQFSRWPPDGSNRWTCSGRPATQMRSPTATLHRLRSAPYRERQSLTGSPPQGSVPDLLCCNP